MQRKNNSQAGMTLVELMIAMVIASVIIFFLFSIQTRMSRAYQGQGTVSEINQNLQAAKHLLVSEMRMAGFGLAGDSGAVSVASTVDAIDGSLSGFAVFNDAFGDGNDSFTIQYTDADTSILLLNVPTSQQHVDSVEALPPLPIGKPVILRTRSAACMVAITSQNNGGPGAGKAFFNATPVGRPFNEPPRNEHCTAVRDAVNPPNNEKAFLEFSQSRSYRIDPDRPGEGYLQQSPSGGIIADDWIDMGVGFTNMQIATRYFEAGDTVDLDGDGDPERDWYSSDNQAEGDPSRPVGAVLIQASLSIEARSPFGTRGSAASTTTPAYIDLTNVDNNPIGDWGQDCAGAPTDPCGINLATTPDASRPDRYQGEFIYRSITTIVDLRNMGVGR